jgi:hypothetical protein
MDTSGGGIISPTLPAAFYMPQAFHPMLSPSDGNAPYEFSVPLRESASPSSSITTDEVVMTTSLDDLRLSDEQSTNPAPVAAPVVTPSNIQPAGLHPSPTPAYYVPQGNPVLFHGHLVVPPPYAGYFAPPAVPSPAPAPRPRSQSQPPGTRQVSKSTYKSASPLAATAIHRPNYL